MTAEATKLPDTFARSGIISLTGSAFAAISALTLTTIVGRNYGAAGAGLFFQTIGLFSVIAGFLKLGTSSGLIRAISRERALSTPSRNGHLVVYAGFPVLIISIIVSLGIYLNATILATYIAHPTQTIQIAEALRIISPFLIAASVLSVLHTAIRMSHGVLAFTVLQNILIPLGRILFVVVAVIVGWDITGAIAAWVGLLPLWLLLAFGMAVKAYTRNHRGRQKLTESHESFSSFWRFTSGRAVSAAVEVCLEWADVLIVAALRPAWEAGVYAVVTRANRAGQVADRALRVAVSPTIAYLLARGDHEEAASLHTAATKALILVTWPFYLCLITLAPAVLNLFGAEFAQGSSALALLAGASLVATLGGMLQSIMLMGGRSSWQVYNKGVVLVLSTALNLLLVPRFGFVAAAWCFVAVVLIDTLIAAIIVQRGVGVKLYPGKLVTTASLPLLLFGGSGFLMRGVLPMSTTTLLVYLSTSGAVYIFLLWNLRHKLGLSDLIDLGTKEGP